MNGSNKLVGGLNYLNTNYNYFDTSLAQLKDGGNELLNGSNALTKGIKQAKDGSNKLVTATDKLEKLNNSVNELSLKTNQLNEGVISYVGGVNDLMNQSTNVSSLLINYVQNNPASLNDPNIQQIMAIFQNPDNLNKLQLLNTGGNDLKSNIDLLNQNINLLSQNTQYLPVIHGKLVELNQGINQIDDSNLLINQGINQISSNLEKVTNASNEIDQGINGLTSGGKIVNGGINDLNKGEIELEKNIDQGINTSLDEQKKLNGIDNYTANSFKLKNEAINPVANYGTAFAPYFMSLSLYIGGIMIFFGIYLDQDSRFQILSRKSNRPRLRTLIYLGIGLIQAFIIAFILHNILGIKVNNLGIYYLACCLVSVVFVSIIQFFMVFFKDVGKFLVILLLILQLTACGGTFPMETVPKFFNIIYPFMPMTYSVNLFREAISGNDISMVIGNIIVLLIILIVTATLTFIFSKKFKK